MFKNYLIILLIFLNIGFGQLHRANNIEDMKRADGKLYVWIYFKNKGQSLNKVQLSDRTIIRRNKANPQMDFSWYDSEPSENYINDVIDTGAKVRGKSRWFNAISIECDKEQLSKIYQLQFVEKIQPLQQYHKSITNKSENERAIGKSSFIEDIDYGKSIYQLEQINVPRAHDAGYSGNGISILILDSGYNLDHPAFDSLSVIAEWDVINNDSTTSNETGQDIGSQQNHGTSVLSITGGYAPGNLIGPAFKADYLLAKTEDIASETPVEEDYFVLGLEWGEARGADIVTTSVGYTDWYTPNDMDGNTALITKAYDKAAELGVLCIASAGNENTWDWKIVTPPADADSVISVGSVKIDGRISNFSSRGPTFDERIKPEVCAMGDSTYKAVGSTSYHWGDGTSFAAPLVAGAAALVMEAHPDWPAMAIREAILETASQSNSPNNTYGWGIMDTWAAINYNGGSALKPELEQNYPNPVKISTTIEYVLKQSSRVKLKIYDILGNEIIELVNGFEPSGSKSVIWDGRNSKGRKVSSGVYFYSLHVGETQITNKMVYIN